MGFDPRRPGHRVVAVAVVHTPEAFPMFQHDEKVELFRALEVKEVENRAQHVALGTEIGSSSYYD